MVKSKKFLYFIIVSILAFFNLSKFSYFSAEALAADLEYKPQKTVAVLTSGGDAPGMNAAIRAFTKTALNSGMKVIGVRYGYEGFFSRDFIEMKHSDVSGINREGGTMLHTSRSIRFNTPEGVKEVAEICKEMNITGIAVIGGDGTFRGARDLANIGINCVGIPATIDNDINCSEYTIGFDTANNTVMQLIDKVRDTSKSHDRCFVIEVMGRSCGDIAVQTGIASEAISIIVPEIDFDFQTDIIDKIKAAQKNGETHFIVVVAEGISGAEEIAKQIEELTGIDTRYVILGHVQRGGAPTVKDREIASRMGIYAAKLLSANKGRRVVVIRDGKIADIDINEALSTDKCFDKILYEDALNLGL